MIKSTFSILLILLTFGLVSCGDDENYVPIENNIINIPEEQFDYINLNLPSHFTNDVAGQPLPTTINGLDNTPNDNPVTNEGATLGRVLFYDKSLSANGTIACASCHKQDKGFSDDAILSIGFDGGLTGRHSMT
jgi:cytochrome c peroxidase